jgi:hypothetical protein
MKIPYRAAPVEPTPGQLRTMQRIQQLTTDLLRNHPELRINVESSQEGGEPQDIEVEEKMEVEERKDKDFMPRRVVAVDAAPKSKVQVRTETKTVIKKGAKPLYTWVMESSKPRFEGEYIRYLTRLEEDGSLRCDCPGWCFQKKDKKTGEKLPRTCRHTQHVEQDAKDIYKRIKAGEMFEVIEKQGNGYVAITKAATDPVNEIGFGRVVRF